MGSTSPSQCSLQAPYESVNHVALPVYWTEVAKAEESEDATIVGSWLTTGAAKAKEAMAAAEMRRREVNLDMMVGWLRAREKWVRVSNDPFGLGIYNGGGGGGGRLLSDGSLDLEQTKLIHPGTSAAWGTEVRHHS
jgi:hypothetical protein